MKQETSMAAVEMAQLERVGTMAPVRHWRIHLGAHKTATTHLQETLTAVRPALAERGLDYLPNQLVRERRLARELWRRRPIARMPLIGAKFMREAIEAVVEPLRLGPETVVLSEENILGIPDQILGVPFYPQAAQSVSRLASLTARAKLVFFLSIRGYETLLPSAYAESLKFRPPREGGFNSGRLMAETPSWYDLVTQIHRAAPGVSLRIWRQEDYRANAHEIMAEVCGLELGPLPDISDPSWTRSPTAEGIRQAEALDRELSMKARRAQVGEIYATAGGERYRPFGEAERTELRARYAADLARIEQDFPGEIMRFPG
jgi:hypothetical protein